MYLTSLGVRGLPAARAAMALVSTMVLLAVLNVALPAGGTLAFASGFDAVRGGLNWAGIIDASCTIAGVGALFLAANPYAMAFCAGWTLGKFLNDWW